MNFLEGLKRLFVVLSLVVISVAGTVGWSEGAPPYWCGGELVVPAPSTNPFDQFDPQKPGSLKPFNGKLDDPCRSHWVEWGKSAAYAAGFAFVAAAVMFVLWLCLRWIIVGFFPGAARKA